MSFKIKTGRPSLFELVEIAKSAKYALSELPWGKVSNMDGNTYIVKRAAPWKGVKGESFKKYITPKKKVNLYEVTQKAANNVRARAASAWNITYTPGMRGKATGVAVVRYADGSIGIMPKWSAELGMNGKKGKITEILYEANSKEQALRYINERAVSTPVVSVTQ